MSKVTKKQVFVFREVRKKYIDDFGNFNLLKYSVYDLIRRRRKSDTQSFEDTYKSVADWLGVSKGSITMHINSLLDLGLIKENDLGLELLNNDIDDYILKENKRSFVILDFEIREKINEDFKILSKRPTRRNRKGTPEKEITLEQFAILSMLFSMQITRYRKLSLSGISRLLILNRRTVKNGIEILKELNLIDANNKVTENIVEGYFYSLKRQILNKGNGLQAEQLTIEDDC